MPRKDNVKKHVALRASAEPSKKCYWSSKVKPKTRALRIRAENHEIPLPQTNRRHMNQVGGSKKAHGSSKKPKTNITPLFKELKQNDFIYYF
ncbi:unnamed protein product [Ilex paraguariensis]|uniref:Uncharacterized protein n=1 Tax=Ilex paraguariensis TaxID=185542 RepID=A0ABC8RS04_9AQUA